METKQPATAVIRQPGEGAKRWFFGGGVHTWKARAEETAGAFLLFEDEMGLGKVTPLHTHPDADETMYILAGEILVNIDGTEHRVAAGGLVIAPRGVAHAFKVLQEGTKVLCLHTPGGAQAFYDGASEPLSGSDDPNGSGAVDFSRIQASGQAHGGIEIIGPPPFAQP
ncbi:cupin domain-containing protein [Arthrobacter sp. OV608]|uniref:cupin domain-containing protein n=1 Tax=Arthrobacter sp. OV608 TaxID=1882768 RepID=UPI0008AC22F4|nr:cupin domain-containing protein [Arthrobacter sp. OV608]SEP80440.1 Cupin domain protein [Arthrobacter sp. OV608]